MQDLRILNLSRRKKNIILLLVDISIIMLVYTTLALLNRDDINSIIGLWTTIAIAVITYVFFLKINNMHKKQSLDIYIPELNLGIEYQGKQHYEEVEFFGGKKGFEDRLFLDNLKREKCKKNNVTLLEWKYDDITTKKRISNRINEIVSDIHK